MSNRLSRHTPVAVHPGEFLQELLEQAQLSQAAFARSIAVSPMRISHVVRGTRPVTADLALRLGKAFRQSAQYWLNLQTDYDLKLAQQAAGKSLRAIHAVQLTE